MATQRTFGHMLPEDTKAFKRKGTKKLTMPKAGKPKSVWVKMSQMKKGY